MPEIAKLLFRNNLLAKLPRSDLDRVRPFLEKVDLPRNASLAEPGTISDYTYFPETGIGSIVVGPPDGRKSEIALFGREGLAPTSGIAGTSSLPYHVFMHVDGWGFRIANVHLQAAMAESVSLRNFLTRYLQAASVQIAYTAYTNAAHQLEARLARWLLMCHDRSNGDQIHLTHKLMSIMLAVRRQSVTEMLHILEGKHLIAAARTYVTIRDRAGLLAVAGDAYGVPEREYMANIGGLDPTA